MAETNPLIDMSLLQEALSGETLAPPSSLPNVPFRAPSLPLPMVDGEPTPSALSVIENGVLATPAKGMLKGGGIPRGLDETQSSRYNVVVPGDYNNEDAYAQGQGWPAKMVNGVGKGLLLTGTTFLQTTLGSINGVARMINDGRAASFYDNEFNRQLDEINKAAEDVLPNYYTDVEKNARWYSPSKLFTGNFLWDGIVKNLGFAAGAALSGAVYASALKAIPLTSRLFSVGKAAETLAATEEALLSAGKAAETYGKVKKLSDNFLGSYNFLNPAGRGLVAALATTGEAGFEAYHNLNDFRDQKIQEWKDTHGGVEPKGSDLESINRLADEVGNASFMLNTSLLSATNYIQFPKIIGSSYRAEKGMINSLVKDTAEITQDATGKFVRSEAKSRSGKLLASINGIRPYLFSTSEAFEEGAQYAISMGAQDYYNKRYNGDVASFMESLMSGVGETFSTDEGMENILIGGLSGAIMLGRGKFQQAAERRKNTADAVQAFNKWNLSDFTKETIESVNRGTTLQEEREAAIRQGDILESKEKEADYIINYLTPRIKYGRYDLVLSDIEEHKRLASTDESFAQLQAEGKALPEDTRSAYLQRLGNLAVTADNIKSLYQSLQLRYGNLVDNTGKPVYSQEVMNKMIYAATKVADYDKRIPQLTTDLLSAGVDTEAVIQDVLSGKEEAFNEGISQIEKMDVNSDIKESLAETLSDLAELTLRRRKFLQEYDQIKKAPQDFKTPEIAETPDETHTVTIKTKDGEEDLIIGEEYFLGRVVEYDKSGKEVYRFPRLTILGENEDGTIRVQDSKGNIKNVDKSVLEDYKLGRVKDTLSNKKAKFYMDHANDIFEFKRKGKKESLRGRLEYSHKDKILNFVYKDEKGKIRTLEVTGEQFVPKKGFTEALITKVGELTPVQRKSLEEFAKEADERLSARLTNRNQILTEVYESSKSRLEEAKKELNKSKDELSTIQKRIEEAPFTKTGNPRKNINIVKKVIARLSKEKEITESRIASLEEEIGELENIIPYLDSLVESAEEIPNVGQELINSIKEDINLLEDTIEETRKAIEDNKSFLKQVEDALFEALSLINDYIKRLREENPNIPLFVDELLQQIERFLGEEGAQQYIEQRLGFTEATLQLEDDISSFREELKVPDLSKKADSLKSTIKTLEDTLDKLINEQLAKVKVLDRFQEIADLHRKAKEEEVKIAKDEALKKSILGTADTGVQTRQYDKDYEPQSKKTNIGVVTSSKPWFDVNASHFTRANIFGQHLDKFPNRRKIKGVLVTSKNEAQILPGLTAFLKGNSDVDPNKIIALVMEQDGKPVGADGKILTSPSTENAIFQVMPDTKLTWNDGTSMFRKETTPEQIEYYKKQYTEWVNEVLENPPTEAFNIEASFGIPEYVTYLDEKGKSKRDYTAVVSVEEAGLVKSSDLAEAPLLKVSTLDTIDKGSTFYTNSLGRIFLNLPNAYVALQNRKLTKREAATIYEAVRQLSIEANPKSEKSERLIKWLKTVIYWGTPKNKAGHNSLFFEEVDDNFFLVVSGKGKRYSFTPSNIEANKGEIITLIEGMYNNVQSGKTDKDLLWNEVYEEIVNITPSGEIETKEWPNYQTYLLSTTDRKKEELPLSVQIKPIKEGETNRTGIYFTIKDTVERFAAPPTKKELKPKILAKSALEIALEESRKQAKELGIPPDVQAQIENEIRQEHTLDKQYVLDGKTINEFMSPAGKIIKFAAKGLDDITVVKGGDLDTVLADLTAKVGEEKAKENIKNFIKIAIAPQIKIASEVEVTIEGESKPKRDIFSGSKSKTKAPAKPKKDIFGQPTVTVTEEDEQEMNSQMDDLEDDEIVLRVKLDEASELFETEKWHEVEKWLKSNFPNVPVYRVKNIIQATNGKQAWGMFKDGAIYVYENAEVGTVYHEVFEGVWKTFATPDEQTSVVSEFRARKGSFTDRPTGRTVKYTDATDMEVKEQLAEEFRDFVLFKKVPQKPDSGKPFIIKLFNDIVDFIKTFFTGEKAITNTEKLFQKIGTGYYKQYTPLSPKLVFAKKGIIDIEEAFASSDSEFRIANIPANIVNDIMQQMTYLTLYDLVKENKSLFGLPKQNKEELYAKLKADIGKTILKSRKIAENEVASGRKTQAQVQGQVNSAVSLWKTVNAQWTDLRKKHEEYLRVYNIEFDENDDVILKDEDASKRGDYQDATKIDTFKKANAAVKLLLSTIPRVDSNGKLVYSSINGATLLPTTEVFMAVMNKVHTSRNIDEMISRVKELADENPNYRTLYNRLTKNANDLSQISEVHDAQLLAAFWRTFKKQNPDVKNIYIFENGDIEVGDSSLSSAARQISADYSNAIIKTVKSKNPYFEYIEKERIFRGKPEGAKKVKLSSDQNRIAFLKSLGIEFKLNELAKLDNDQIIIFREAVAGIRKSIEDAEKIATIGRKVLGIQGRLMKLSLIRAKIDNPEFDSTFFNVKGERTQSFIGTNPVSDLYDELSQIDNLSELEGTRYEYLLTDSFAQGSYLLSKMFNLETGNRIKGTEQLMKPGYADGTVDIEKGKKKQSAKLTYKERLVQEINLNLKGYYYNLVPGDSSLEWMLYMGNPVTSTSLLSGPAKVYSIFKDYFISEINLSRENRSFAEIKGRKSTDLRFFKDILGAEIHDKIVKEKGSPEVIYDKYVAKINKSIDSYIEKETKKFQDTLFRYGILEFGQEGLKVNNLAFATGETISEEVLNRELSALSINFIINNIELHKLLYADPYQYKDELKRVKSANSPRQAIISNSPAMNKALHSIWNEEYSKGDIGHTDFVRDYFRTATLSDVIATSELKDYGTFEETDGSGIISMKAYRNFRIRAGEWNEDEERQYKFDIAYEKKVKDLPLSEAETKLLKDEKELTRKGLLGIKSAYTPLKPIVFGNKGNNREYNDIVLDKYALYPISFRILHILNPNSNAIKLYNKMQREDIDYAVFASGRKVGNEGENALYNPDGSFNNLPFRATVNIPNSIIAIQSEVPSKEDNASPRGSQITKLVTLDFMEAGIPVDYGTGTFKSRLESWSKLTEEERKEQSPLYKEIKYNQELLEASIEEGYTSLLKRMGIEESNDRFTITNPDKIANTLEEEILKREVNDNILDAFEGFRKGDVVLEATPAYQQIRNILYSLADKNVISPKITGGQKVQIPSTLLESVRAEEVNGGYASDILRFYENEGGKRTAEIMVGRWFNSPLSDQELLDYLNKTEEGQKILAGVAYRIPTQKQNSIESFVIKQFLPKEFGDSVIVPSALVKKVGSDFDIDKLYIYLKNTYVDGKGKIKLLPFYGFGEQAVTQFEKLFTNVLKVQISEAEKSLEKQTKLSNLFSDIALGLASEKTINKWAPIFEQWFAPQLENENLSNLDSRLPVREVEAIFMSRIERLNKKLDKLTDADMQEVLAAEMSERWYKQSIQNEYIQSLQTLVSHPLNFENLVKPNSAKQLKDLAKEVTKKQGFEEFNYASTGNMLSREFMTRLRHAFVSGKYTIGIAAVNQTNHSLNQRQPIYIDIDRWDTLSYEDQYWLSGGSINPEDVDIKFKNFNKIEINGKIVPTFSMIKNAAGEFISDILGQFIDGYVDISKGPWIMELGATQNVAPVWLTLIKMGVPVTDVAYFMNQPIIRDYLRQIESAGYSWLFIDTFVDDMNKTYKPNSQVVEGKEIPSTSALEKMIGKAPKDLTDKQKGEQILILKEFLKYAKMANHIFLVTQGSNFDTANFNDPYLVFKKFEQLKKAQSTIISSVDDLMENSFIGKLSETIYDMRNAFSTVLSSDRKEVRKVIERVLRPYVNLNDRDFVKLAQKAVNDLFDWAIQVDRGLNKEVTRILLSDTNAAKQMSDFVVSVKKDTKHPLYNNQIINLVTPHFSSLPEGVNNLKIKNKDNKVYDQNQMIYAFAELREFLDDSPLYGSLVRLAVLQSGLSNSPLSFTSLLPYEDFKAVYNKTLSTLESMPNLEQFYKLDVFQRNNWSNDDIVPLRRARKSRGGEGKYNTNMIFYGNNKVSKAIRNKKIPPLLKINNLSREINNDIIIYTWVTAFGDRAKKMREKGDFSYIKKGLFKKVYRGNEPLTQSYPIKDKNTGETKIITDTIYKPINAWGESHSTDGIYFSANEFYATGRESVIDNGFIKVKEVDDSTVISFFEDAPVEEGSDQMPPCS